MQTYDLLMVLVLLAATLFGFWKGMAWQVASLASLVVSYFAALRFSTQLAPVFGNNAPLNRFAAMFAIYIGTSFFVWTMFRAVSRAIDRVRLEAFDKQLGAMLGFAKGVLLCVAITFFAVTLLPPAQGQAIVGSQSGRYIVALLDKTHSVVPPELHQVIDPYLNQIEERLKPGYQQNNQGWQGGWPQAQSQTPSLPTLPSLSWPQISWPQQSQQPQQPAQQTQPGWPTSAQTQSGWPSASPSDSGWPSTPSNQFPPAGQYSTAQRETDLYSQPQREPNPFPGPYSAERQAGREY